MFVIFITGHCILVHLPDIFTARVRSTTGKYCFHRCLSVNICGGGYPIPGLGGGVPCPGLDGGAVPHPRSRVGDTPGRSGWWGVPHPRSGVGVPLTGLDGEGTPSQVWVGGYPGQVWMVEGTPSQVWSGGVPQKGLDGGSTPFLGWGVPWPGLDGGDGTPSLGYMGTPARSGWWGVPGVPPDQVWMDGGYPGTPHPLDRAA